jgi:predicted Zn-dependent protease
MNLTKAIARRNTLLAVLSALLVLGACSTNPVTGKNEFLLMSESQELSIGKSQYAPLRQAQGGDYVVDKALVNYVRSVGRKLAKVSDRKLPYEFNVINDSTPNAWALPGGKISINRGLLVELKSEAELAAVLGHEIVHAAAKHGARGQTRGIALQGLVLGATIAGSREGYGELAQLGSTIGAQLINSKYGRGAELESDLYGMEYMKRAGYSVQGAVELQQTFVRLSAGRRQDFLSGLFASHPPSPERVKANIATAARLGTGGDAGVKRYRQAMARLTKAQPAYVKYEQAREALKNKKSGQAAALVKQAIRIEPKEARFHSLLGDIAQIGKDYPTARKRYDKAISLDDSYFYYYLQRGNVNQASRNMQAARADFSRSNQLFPTADAQAGLGQIAQLSGNTAEAKKYYALAAQAQGPTANKARQALLKLDPPSSSSDALLVRQGVSRKGTFAISLINQTSRPISNVQLGFQSKRTNKTQTQQVSGVIPAGKSRLVDTGLKMTREQMQNITVIVLKAQVGL